MLRAIATVLWGASIACGRLSFEATGAGDAAGEPEPEPDTFDRCAVEDVLLGTWSAPQLVSELSTAFVDEDPVPAFDDLELFFVSTRGGDPDIYRTTRADLGAPWGAPALVTELAAPSDEATPALSDDALTMWFTSNRAGGIGDDDIWVTTRSDRSSPWAAPVNLTEINSTAAERGPTVFDDERALIFHSARPVGPGGNDLYLSTRSGPSAVWSTAVELGPPNSTFSEQHAWVSPCGRWLVFHTNRSGVVDLYEATRTSSNEPFGAAMAITELNTASTDRDLRMLADRRRAYFTSNRGGDFDIYVVTR